MSHTPLHDEACKSVDFMHRNRHRIGNRIKDPQERLRFYQAIAADRRPEQMLVRIRIRAERNLNRMLRAR